METAEKQTVHTTKQRITKKDARDFFVLMEYLVLIILVVSFAVFLVNGVENTVEMIMFALIISLDLSLCIMLVILKWILVELEVISEMHIEIGFSDSEINEMFEWGWTELVKNQFKLYHKSYDLEGIFKEFSTIQSRRKYIAYLVQVYVDPSGVEEYEKDILCRHEKHVKGVNDTE